MSEAAAPSPKRGGCALVLGAFLIASGALLLARNLFDYSLFPLMRRGILLLADYWPLLLVGWGAYKIYHRFANPREARVSALEIVLLSFLILGGLSVTATRRVMERLSGRKLEDLVLFSPDALLGAPVQHFPTEERFAPGEAVALRIANPGGRVSVRGGEGAEIEVALDKRVRHASESEAAAVAESVRLAFDASGPAARLAVLVPDGSPPVDCDLEVRVPRSLSVAIENRRGRVETHDIDGPVRVETAHDRIDASNLKGGLSAATRHGEIRARDVAGPVHLRNQHGAIAAERIAGDLRAETTHGRIRAEEVTGSAVLETRHAPIAVSGVAGELQVKGENSQVSVERVGGSVAITASHEAIFARGVAGSLTIEASNAPIQASDVRGDVAIEDRDERVVLVGIGGRARVRAPQSAVTVEEVEGAIEIESSHDDVRVLDFGSSLSVRSTHAEVRAASSRISGNVTLQTTYGDVELRIPRGASIRVEARARDGELRSRVAGLDLKQEGGESERSWRGALGTAEHVVAVETSYGNVLLEPEGP
jgi:DUF4097 and DUF4098 domain-containing protein YvlB